MQPDSEPHWLQVRLDATGEGVVDLAEALLAAGALSVSMEDAADNPVLEPLPGETPLWPETRVLGLFEATADLAAALVQVGTILGRPAPEPVEIRRIAPEDWAHSWRQHFHAMRFGKRLWVAPPGEPVPDPGAVMVRMEPGLAFGTGTHPSTALCLQWLDRHPPQSMRVLDYGCGSGILGIAAARLGAREVWAVDIDPQARQATADNARRNGVEHLIRVVTPEALPPLAVNCVVANILAHPLIELAPRLKALLAPGGRIALAGLLTGQASAVAAAYTDAIALDPPKTMGGWTLVHGRRR